MSKNNVYGNAKIVHTADSVVPFQMGAFIQNSTTNQTFGGTSSQQEAKTISAMQSSFIDPYSANSNDTLSAEIKNLLGMVNNINQKVTQIENDGVRGKDLDKQIVTAIRDLKHYANFFEQATFALEAKVLKTSISIAKKIIGIEVSQNSTLIAKETIKHILAKLKTASRVTIHLNPKDYLLLKTELQLESHIILAEDPNVTQGGVVIASDLGNFDGNIEAKVASMLETLDTIS